MNGTYKKILAFVFLLVDTKSSAIKKRDLNNNIGLSRKQLIEKRANKHCHKIIVLLVEDQIGTFFAKEMPTQRKKSLQPFFCAYKKGISLY